MGGWISYVWWGGDPDAVNSFSGMTKREVYIVQKTWAAVHANALANGTELFRRLFNTYPETKDFFRVVRKLPEEKYINSAQFKAHIINLMTSLNLAIVNLNQPEIAAAMMNKLGESHAKRKIKEIHFIDFKGILVNMFTNDLKLDKDTLSAWGKAIDFLYKHIFEILNESESS